MKFEEFFKSAIIKIIDDVDRQNFEKENEVQCTGVPVIVLIASPKFPTYQTSTRIEKALFDDSTAMNHVKETFAREVYSALKKNGKIPPPPLPKIEDVYAGINYMKAGMQGGTEIPALTYLMELYEYLK